MKKIKTFRKWGIFENSAKEVEEYGFKVSCN